jgi:Domain of unknown function (DUF4114)/Calx-beta domain
MAVIPSTGLNALINETGKIYLSVDGKGTTSSTGIVKVLKNAGATVRKAYLVGDGTSNSTVGTTASVNGKNIIWDRIESTSASSSFTFYSYLSDVTDLVKSTIDAAAAGTLDIAVNEGTESPSYEGLALAVVFDDPNQTVDKSVILYFGGLKPTGGTATINFASPINTSSTVGATLGLGIGYSSNDTSTQTSQVKVNGQVLTSVAGNNDDGSTANGTLFTIGGIGDTDNNPSPSSTDIKTDDELYNLLPFIKNGDTALTLNTVNPSNDDHIFFAHLTLQGITGTDSSNVVKLAVAPTSVNEDGTSNLVYTFTRTGATTNPLTVSYTVSGTAELTKDYSQTGAASFTATTGTVTFAAGANTATVTIDPIADTVIEADETVLLTLTTGTGYAVGTSTAVTGTIINDDALPIITIAKGTDAAEPSTNGNFVLTRTGDFTNPLTVNLATTTGTATSGVDYQSIAQTVTFAAGSNTAKVDVIAIDDTLVEATETISLALATGSGYTLGTTATAEINLTDNDPLTTPTTPTTQNSKLNPLTGNILQLQSTNNTSVLKFTKTAYEAVSNSEVCAFVVDDEQGRIGGIAPGDVGYLAAALDRSQVIFSTLSNRSNNSGFDLNSQRNLQFNSGDRLEFCLIADDTIDAVKANIIAGKPTAKVLFSLAEANTDKSNQTKFTALANNGGYQIAWEDIPDNTASKSDKDFNDFVLKVESLDTATIATGTSLQAKSEGQVLDLRGLTATTIKVDTLAVSDAAYNNYIGFYAVEDALGTLANGLKPSDIGYAEAAIKSAILRSSKNESQSDLTVTTGKILAPVVIANSTFENFLATNPTNQANSNVHAYFNYIGANTDKVDHFRLLGDNKFGVEDIYGGGDRDYNDIVFQVNFKG